MMIRYYSFILPLVAILLVEFVGCSDGVNDEPVCGNGVKEPGEICDGDCPSECNKVDTCTIGTLSGSAESCDAVCIYQSITECADGDGCCPDGCNYTMDSDCPDMCGNGVIDSGETCDGDCPTECNAGDTCTIGILSGSAESCDAVCIYQPITECTDGDGCCPDTCDYFGDSDCMLCEAAEEPEDLRVNLPADEGAHEDQLEWWYWTGHLHAGDDRWFGFQIVFFLLDASGVWGQVAHHAITDITDSSFHFVSNAALGRPEDSEEGYILNMPQVTVEGGKGSDLLHCEVDDFILDLFLVAIKSPVYQHGNGHIDYPFGGNTYYYSRERMNLQGTLSIADEELAVTGAAWFDHQWGALSTVTSIGWDWFALQLDDYREIMIYIIHDGETNLLVGGSYTDAECNTVELGTDEIEVITLDEWTSPHTGCTYPMGWDISVMDMIFAVTPVLEDQELHGTILQDYWEGAATVTGDATGRAYVELTGY